MRESQEENKVKMTDKQQDPQRVRFQIRSGGSALAPLLISVRDPSSISSPRSASAVSSLVPAEWDTAVTCMNTVDLGLLKLWPQLWLN